MYISVQASLGVPLLLLLPPQLLVAGLLVDTALIRILNMESGFGGQGGKLQLHHPSSAPSFSPWAAVFWQHLMGWSLVIAPLQPSWHGLTHRVALAELLQGVVQVLLLQEGSGHKLVLCSLAHHLEPPLDLELLLHHNALNLGGEDGRWAVFNTA